MNLLDRLFGRGRDDDEGDANARLVVVDTETTGLDPDRDELLAIGAVAVDGEGVLPGDSFEVVLRNASAGDAANIAIHGIGYAAQATGIPAADALLLFRDYVAGARCVGFHADFDRKVLQRASAATRVPFDGRAWLDVAQLAGALEPAMRRSGRRSLDDWLEAYRIGTDSRHNAAGDALATAELLLRLRANAAVHGSTGFAGLVRVVNHLTRLSGGH